MRLRNLFLSGLKLAVAATAPAPPAPATTAPPPPSPERAPETLAEFIWLGLRARMRNNVDAGIDEEQRRVLMERTSSEVLALLNLAEEHFHRLPSNTRAQILAHASDYAAAALAADMPALWLVAGSKASSEARLCAIGEMIRATTIPATPVVAHLRPEDMVLVEGIRASACGVYRLVERDGKPHLELVRDERGPSA